MGPHPQESPPSVTYVYVCLHCGRRSLDRRGVLALSEGWNPKCAARALRLPTASITVDGNGLVSAVSKKAVLEAVRAEIN